MTKAELLALLEEFSSGQRPLSEWPDTFKFSPNDALKVVKTKTEGLEDNDEVELKND